MQKIVTPYDATDKGKKDQVADMFNNISGTYDFLNHFMSLGIDFVWRKKAIKELQTLQPRILLDVATGTGDFAFEAFQKIRLEKVVGIDISEGMLAQARKKIDQKGLSAKFSVQLGDAENLPFADHSFDAITVAFGVRNFENLEKGLTEMLRVLKPGGKLVVLEFAKPNTFGIKQLYNFYFKYITPTIGGFFSKDKKAYAYLPESVAAFPYGEQFTEIMKKCGYNNAKFNFLTFGVSAIYTGIK